MQQPVHIESITRLPPNQGSIDEGYKYLWRCIRHSQGPVAVEAIPKDGQAPHHRLLFSAQQRPGTLEEGAHAAVTGGQIAQGRAQEVAIALDFGGDFLTGHQPHPAGSQFDGQGHPLHGLADGGHIRLFVFQGEVRFYAACRLLEQSQLPSERRWRSVSCADVASPAKG